MQARKFSGGIVIASLMIVAQYILAFFVYKLPGLKPLQWAGWFVWIASLIFGVAPIFILRQKGDVEKGKSYVKTRVLVDTSLYAVVRHPQYLGGILLSVALMLLAQHWLIILLGCVSAILIWLDIQAADQECIEKFGDVYRQYMQRVPQVNFIRGTIRLMRTKRVNNDETIGHP
jgi:protein-S-isoprenylcysteine O-methyltransferase Ste14